MTVTRRATAQPPVVQVPATTPVWVDRPDTASVGVTTYISDGFGGAGATLAGRTPDTVGAATWSVLFGTFNTDGTQATCTVGGVAVIDSAHADASISVTLAGVGAGDTGIAFRATDIQNYWYLVWQPSFPRWTLTKLVANVATIVDSSHTSPTPVNGDVLKIVLSGDNITAYLNGVSFLTATSSQFNTVTKHGLASINAGVEAWDNFQATS